MAQHDTGLGWSANEEWLVSAGDAVIGSLSIMGGASFPGQPVGRAATINDMAAVALPYMNTGNAYWTYIANDTSSPGDIVVFYYQLGTTKYWAIVSDRSPIIYHKANKFLDNNQWWAWDTFNVTNPSYDATSGLYYAQISTGGSATNVPQTPEFSSLRAGLDAIQVVHSDFTKPNAGFAVACVAKWKTGSDVIIHSPILISSESSYTDMTDSSDTYNLAKLNVLLQGTRFYMAFYDITDADPTTSLPTLDLTDRGALTLEQVFMIIISTDNAHVIIITSPDPYEHEGGGSGEEGGDGEELEDDEMGISHHAIPAAINTGFCRIYCPTEQQLRDLSNYLWSAQYDLAAVKKLFANPMDAVLGLSAVPLTLSGANHAVYLGGVDTEMSFPMVSYQSYQVPMGAITVEKRWGSYLDYDPYTRFSIFLPFIGFKDLSADDIMGKQIILDYDVDILSGACTARLQAGGNVLYQWSGQCSIQLPVTSSNWNQVFQGATSAALSAGLAVATGSAGPVLAGALAAEGAQAIMGKPRIERGGTASGAAGWMGGLTPYLVRVTPEAIIPNDQNKFIGYPAFSSISLDALTGYNEISSIHLEGIPATGAELEELEAILKGGVIF